MIRFFRIWTFTSLKTRGKRCLSSYGCHVFSGIMEAYDNAQSSFQKRGCDPLDG